MKFAALYQLAAYIRDNWAGAKSAQLDSILDQLDGMDEPESLKDHQDVVVLLRKLSKLVNQRSSHVFQSLHKELETRISQYGAFVTKRTEKCMSPLQWKLS